MNAVAQPHQLQESTTPSLFAQLERPAPNVAQALHPDGLQPQETLLDTISTLHRLPHLKVGSLELMYPEGSDTTQVKEHVVFPMNRIVGVASFNSWAGRGLAQNGEAKRTGGFSSAGTIDYYAHREAIEDYEPDLTVFKDNQGEVWGTIITDGSHRTAAAKMKGQPELVCKAYFDDYDRLPTVDINVGQEILAQDRMLKSFVGRTLLRREAKRLAVASEKVEQEAAERKAQMTTNDDYIV